MQNKPVTKIHSEPSTQQQDNRTKQVDNKALVKVVWNLLKDASSGQMSALAFAAVKHNGDVITAIGGHLDVFRMAGALEELKLHLLLGNQHEN